MEVQVMPPALSEDRTHVLTKDCWCEPTVEVVAGKRSVRHVADSDVEAVPPDDGWDPRASGPYR